MAKVIPIATMPVEAVRFSTFKIFPVLANVGVFNVTIAQSNNSIKMMDASDENIFFNFSVFIFMTIPFRERRNTE
jgi:hypothetical protein